MKRTRRNYRKEPIKIPLFLQFVLIFPIGAIIGIIS